MFSKLSLTKEKPVREMKIRTLTPIENSTPNISLNLFKLVQDNAVCKLTELDTQLNELEMLKQKLIAERQFILNIMDNVKQYSTVLQEMKSSVETVPNGNEKKE